jgi:hypothetical protein
MVALDDEWRVSGNEIASFPVQDKRKTGIAAPKAA